MTNQMFSIVMTLIMLLGGIIVAIIGYFLRKTMDDLETTKTLGLKTKSELDVLKNDHDNKHTHLSEKMEDLKDTMILLTNEIKNLTSKIK